MPDKRTPDPQGPPYLSQLRKDAGLSQQQVADKMGVTQQAVAKWEKNNDPGEYWIGGKKRADGTREPALCVVLGVYEAIPGAPFNPAQRALYIEERGKRIPLLNAALEERRKLTRKARA